MIITFIARIMVHSESKSEAKPLNDFPPVLYCQFPNGYVR